MTKDNKNPDEDDNDSFFLDEEKLGKLLKELPISCLENIVPVRGNADDAITEIKKHIVANLIEAFQKETNVQLRSNIARALRKIDRENCINVSLSSLHDPDVCRKERNELWIDIIGKWKNNHRNIDIESLCNALKAMLKRQIYENAKGSIFIKKLFRSRVFELNSCVVFSHQTHSLI